MTLALLLSVALAPQVGLKLEAGSEVDSNVHRALSQTGQAVAAMGGRIAARLAAALRPPRGLVRLSALGALKVFPAPGAATENVAVVSSDLRYDVPFGAVAPGLRLGYFDVMDAAGGSVEAGQDRDFRTGDAAAGLALRTEDDHRIEASAGYRFFVYKPDHNFNFTGAHVGLGLARRARFADGTSEIAYAASYTLSERAYEGRALANVCPGNAMIVPSCLLVTDLQRADLFHDVSLDFSYTHAFIVSARYQLQINDSNSYAQSLVRHRVEASGTIEVGWDVFLTGKLVLIVNQFLDAQLLSGDVGTFITIEDEARNAVILHATRDLGEALTLEARYSFYTNSFATRELAYRRQTFYLGVVYSFEP